MEEKTQQEQTEEKNGGAKGKVLAAVIITALVTPAIIYAVIYLFFNDKVTFNFGNQQPAAEQQDEASTAATEATTVETAIPEGFVAYNNNDLCLSFSYPEEWGTVTEGTFTEAPGTSGDYPIFNFSKKDDVSFGGPAANWRELGGRGGTHTDAPGYYKFGVDFYTVSHSYADGTLAVNPVQADTIEKKLLEAKNTQVFWAEFPVEEYYGHNYIEARVNVACDNHYGIVFVHTEIDEATKTDLETLAKSIEVN